MVAFASNVVIVMAVDKWKGCVLLVHFFIKEKVLTTLIVVIEEVRDITKC